MVKVDLWISFSANDQFKQYDIRTSVQGLSEILNDGSLFIEETQAGRTARTAIEKAIDAGEDVAGELAIFSIKVANFIKKKAKASQKADK